MEADVRDTPDPVAVGAVARGDTVGARLHAMSGEPWAYDFFAVMRRLEVLAAPAPRWGHALLPSAESVRVGQEPSLSFARASLTRFEPQTEHSPPRIRQQFFGYLGPNGPLPIHLSDFIRERTTHGDRTWLAFLDTFAHRFSLYFYRAWAESRPAVGLDRPDEDRFRDRVGALIGIGTETRQSRDEINDDARLHFSGWLMRNVHCAEGVEAVLRSYFGVPVRLEQWVGHWMRLPAEELTRLGRGGASRTMGMGAMLGRRTWDRQHRVRLHVGPLTLARYRGFLPGGKARTELQRWMKQLLGDELYWDAQLILRKEEVPPTRLGRHRGNAPRLGWVSWLGQMPRTRDAADVRIDGDAGHRARRCTSIAVKAHRHDLDTEHDMSEISRTALFGKLNTLCYKAIEGATVFCKMRGNPYVELEHWFAQLLQAQDSDLHRVIQHYGLDISAISKDMTAALDRLPRGATAISDFSPHIENAIERAWTYATLQFGEAQVRTGYLVVAMLKTPSLRNPLFGLSKQFEKVKVEDLADNFVKICDASAESKMRAQDGTGMGSGAPGEESGAMAPAAMGKGDALKKFAVDLTEKAKKGEMDPVTGRDEEIRQIVDILMRRRQNNPLLTGEAGVGKTAVVEGFAQRLARGDVPPQLKDVKLLTLDIGLLQAGASMKGEFEQRLRQVIDEVQASPTPIILFIDEIHTLVGAGGAAGTGDAANLLKPALARGNLRTIGATTWAEYKKYIEKDPALTRRFQVVQVPEPDEVKAILMLRGVASVLEKHHRVQLLDEAIEAAVKLSHRYIPARQLPDKAVSLLDTACARVAVSQHATPPEVEDCTRRIEALTVESEIIGREEAIGIDVTKRSATAQGLLVEAKAELEKLNARWKEEKELVDKLLDLRGKLRAGNKPVDSLPVAAGEGGGEGGGAATANASSTAAPSPQPSPASGRGSEDREALLKELHELQAQIGAVQGESPLILPSVDAQAVSSVVADWTGIPVGRIPT